MSEKTGENSPKGDRETKRWKNKREVNMHWRETIGQRQMSNYLIEVAEGNSIEGGNVNNEYWEFS